jgi:hypothetical protein
MMQVILRRNNAALRALIEMRSEITMKVGISEGCSDAVLKLRKVKWE